MDGAISLYYIQQPRYNPCTKSLNGETKLTFQYNAFCNDTIPMNIVNTNELNDALLHT